MPARLRPPSTTTNIMVLKFVELCPISVFETPESRMRRGCPMVNSVLELDGVDNGLCQLAANKLAEIRLFSRPFSPPRCKKGAFGPIIRPPNWRAS
jgi:hypothetical protein